jgi:sugar lactone lactonase YvrE
VAGEVCPRAAGPFNYLTELVPAPNGDLYVSDGYRNARVHRFSAAGDLISSWGQPGKGGPNEFHLPHSIIAGQDGRIYLCDRENSRVQVFSPEGEYITMWTDMQRPLDISQDSEGTFYTSERPEEGKPPQISVLDGDGQVLERFPSRSAHGSWVDAHGDLYLALTAEQSIDKYVRVG